MSFAPAHASADAERGETDAVVILEHVWKRYPSEREPHPLIRALARLGGVEVDGGLTATADLEDEDDEEDEADGASALGEPGGTEVLCDLSLAIERGTCVGIVGPSGAGKSVLFRLIAGMTLPTEGRIVVRGMVAPALVSMLRLVPSRFGVRKTLLALAMMARLPRRQVARRLGEIYSFAGIPDPGRNRLVRLSTEQMQRVLVAMAFSVDADVVLLDVQLADERIRTKVFERIRERTLSGRTVLVAAATAEELGDLPDRLIHFEAGRVVWDSAGEPGDTGPNAPAATAPAQFAADGDAPTRALPLSPDAQRYYDYIRVLIGEERAETARHRAVARAPADALRVEWAGVAKFAGFDRVEHLAVVERLREAQAVVDEEPIFGQAELSRERRAVLNDRSSGGS